MKARLNKAKDKTKALLKQGLTPNEVIQSIIVSGLISIIPVLGLTTFLITTVSLKRKLNFPIMISFSFLMWPIQLLMVIPFIRVGEIIFFVPQSHHTIEQIISSFQNSFFQTLTQLSFELLCGLGGWFLTAVPIAIGIYGLSLLILKIKLQNK